LPAHCTLLGNIGGFANVVAKVWQRAGNFDSSLFVAALFVAGGVIPIRLFDSFGSGEPLRFGFAQ
jgi:hypothetical protein